VPVSLGRESGGLIIRRSGVRVPTPVLPKRADLTHQVLTKQATYGKPIKAVHAVPVRTISARFASRPGPDHRPQVGRLEAGVGLRNAAGLLARPLQRVGAPAHLIPIQDAGLHTYLWSLDIRFFHSNPRSFISLKAWRESRGELLPANHGGLARDRYIPGPTPGRILRHGMRESGHCESDQFEEQCALCPCEPSRQGASTRNLARMGSHESVFPNSPARS